LLVDDFNARTAEEQDLIYIEENDFAEDFEGIVNLVFIKHTSK
jgi:hypothetical protein